MRGLLRDKLSLIGIILGLGAIIGGQALEGANVGSLIQLTAFVSVIDGTSGAVLLQSETPAQLMRAGKS